MNPKINEAMEENKIFQVDGKFFRKTLEGNIEEMQQVKSEEIVAKGSRKFLRTIMKFIPKKIYMGNVPGSCPIPPEALKGILANGNIANVKKEGAFGDNGRFLSLNLNQKSSIVNEKTKEYKSCFQERTEIANNKTSLKLNSQVNFETKQQKDDDQKINEDILNEHQEWFKSAQSIYHADKHPSRVEEDKSKQEPIAEIETDYQGRDSKSSSGDLLFDNLNEIYGEEQDVRNEYQLREPSDKKKDKKDDSSYVEIPTRGSENFRKGYSSDNRISFQTHGEYIGNDNI